MQLFRESNKYNYRQTFIGMIESILIDFCELKETNDNLIEQIIIEHFENDLIELS